MQTGGTASQAASFASKKEVKSEIKAEIKSGIKSEIKSSDDYLTSAAPLTLAQLHRMASSLEAPRGGASSGSRYTSYRPASYRPQTLAEALLPVQDEKKEEVAVATVPALVSSVSATVETIAPKTTTQSAIPSPRAKPSAVPYQTGSLEAEEEKQSTISYNTNSLAAEEEKQSTISYNTNSLAAEEEKQSTISYNTNSLAAEEEKQPTISYNTGSLATEEGKQPAIDPRTPAEQEVALAEQFRRILLGTTLLPPHSVVIGAKLGNGAFGQVFQGTWGDRPVALKEIAIAHAQEQLHLDHKQILESFEWEIARLSAVSHPNLVTYYGLYQQDKRYFITMELCAGGTLRDALGGTKEKPKPKRKLTNAQRWQIALELAEGLAYLHQQGIVHRDLKAANVLLDAEGHAKLADLGVAQVDVLMQRESAEVVEQGFSDKRFNAPEELKAGASSSHSTLASDVFTYGLILWELFTGQEPEKLSYEEVTQRLTEHKHEREPIPTEAKDCPPEFAEIMRACWHPDPKKRPKAEALVGQLHALGNTMHPQAAGVLAQQRSQVLLHEQRTALAYYTPSFALPKELTEDADTFWHMREQKEAKALSEAKEQVAESEEEIAVEGSEEDSIEAREKLDELLALAVVANQLSTTEEKSVLDARLEKMLDQISAIKAKTSKPKTPSPAAPAVKAIEEFSEAKQEIVDDDFLETKDAKETKIVAATGDRLQSISTMLQQFMADPTAQIFVVFGDAGLGKSSSAYQLALRYVQQAQPRYLPLLLRPGLPAWRHSALTDGFNQALASPAYGLSPAQQTALKNQPVLWIIDGYDELQMDIAPQNLPQQLGLAQWPNAKVIISCRRHVVPESEQAARFGWSERRDWERAYLLPLNQQQLLDYIQRRLGWSIAEREAFGRTLNATPRLRALVRNPFVLELFVTHWSAFKDQPLTQLTRFSVYQRSIAHYLEQQSVLLAEPIRRCLQGDYPSLTASFMAMAEILADYGHARDQARVPLQEAFGQLGDRHREWLQVPRLVSHYARHEYRARQKQLDEKQRHRAILSESDYSRLRRQQAEQFLSGSPFKSHQQLQAHDYRHRSLYEYSIAHRMCSTLDAGDARGLFQSLRYRLIQQEVLVLEFVREAYRGHTVERQAVWQKGLHDLIRMSATTTLPTGFTGTPWHWSANAVTLLGDWRISLIQQAWARIQAPGAMLRYTSLAHSDLSHANLRGATLIHTMLYGVDFTGADLRDVQWGERPRLELKEMVDALAYHPREPWVAVAQKNEIVLMHTQSGERLGTFAGHTGWVKSVSFSVDGCKLASGSRDKTVRLWDVLSRQPLGEALTGHTDEVRSVAFSADGGKLASCSQDKTVRLWEVSSGKPIGEPLAGYKRAVYSVSFSPDGGILAFADGETVRLWNVAQQEAIGEPLMGHEDTVRSVSFSPDGQMLASGGDDQMVLLWDVSRREAIGEPLKGHTGWVNSVSFSPDGRVLASGSDDQTVRLWDISRREAIGEPLTGHMQPVVSVSFSPDGRTLASAGSEDCTVRLWNISRGGALEEQLAGHAQEVSSLSFSPDGRTLASSSKDKTVRLWDVATCKMISEPLVGHKWGVTSLSFSPDGRTLLSSGSSDTVRLWDVARGQMIGEPLVGDKGNVTNVCFSPDGRTVASPVGTSFDYSVLLWDVASGQVIGEPLAGHTGRVNSVSFSPDGRMLASGSRDETVRLWDVASGQMIGEPLRAHESGDVMSVSFSPDGRTLASAGGYDKTVRLWDVGRMEAIGEPLAEHEEEVTSVLFSPDGRMLASGSSDYTVRLWDVASQHCVGMVRWHVRIQSIACTRPPVGSVPLASGEWWLAVGDVLGAISYWSVRADGQVRFLGMPKHASIPMLAEGARWRGCQLDASGQRLLVQQGAKLEVEAKSAAEVEEKVQTVVVKPDAVRQEIPPEAKVKSTTAPIVVPVEDKSVAQTAMAEVKEVSAVSTSLKTARVSLSSASSATREVRAGIISAAAGVVTSSTTSQLDTLEQHLLAEYGTVVSSDDGEDIASSDVATTCCYPNFFGWCFGRRAGLTQSQQAVELKALMTQKGASVAGTSSSRRSTVATLQAPSLTSAEFKKILEDKEDLGSAVVSMHTSQPKPPALLEHKVPLEQKLKLTPETDTITTPFVVPRTHSLTGISLFAPPRTESPEAIRQRDIVLLEQVQQLIDSSFDVNKGEELFCSSEYTEQLDEYRVHCDTVPLTDAQRQSVAQIQRACEQQAAKKIGALDSA